MHCHFPDRKKNTAHILPPVQSDKKVKLSMSSQRHKEEKVEKVEKGEKVEKVEKVEK